MALFHPKTHEVAFVYDKRSATSKDFPPDTLKCVLQIDKLIIPIWISKHGLLELHKAGARIYDRKGQIHHDTKEIH